MAKPKVLVLRTAGTNCDVETKAAFEMCGANAELVHINEFSRGAKSLRDYQILAIPGGFTYGDDIGSGKVLANEIKYKLGSELKDFIEEGKLVIGICNGFQVLVKAGILPGFGKGEIETTLTFNDSGKFEDRWIYLKSKKEKVKRQKCVWTRGVKEIIYLPVAHGEGKFIVRDKAVLTRLKKQGQIVFQYVDEKGEPAGYPFNPNGSIENIAGICDPTGRVLGLMPHPERHMLGTQNPQWTREGLKRFGDGISIIRNGVKYARSKL